MAYIEHWLTHELSLKLEWRACHYRNSYKERLFVSLIRPHTTWNAEWRPTFKSSRDRLINVTQKPKQQIEIKLSYTIRIKHAKHMNFFESLHPSLLVSKKCVLRPWAVASSWKHKTSKQSQVKEQKENTKNYYPSSSSPWVRAMYKTKMICQMRHRMKRQVHT
jgi:hypothetical protein